MDLRRTHTCTLATLNAPVGVCVGYEINATTATRQSSVDVASAVTALSLFRSVFIWWSPLLLCR